jgi:hypothetical protein
LLKPQIPVLAGAYNYKYGADKSLKKN